MRYHVFTDTVQPAYPYCLLINDIQADEIRRAYLAPSSQIQPHELLTLTLHQAPDKKKTPKKEIVQYILEELIPALNGLSIDTLLVTDSEYFKALTKATKVEAHVGYVMNCVFGPWKVVYVPTHRAIFYNPDKIKAQITTALNAAVNHRLGNYQAPGHGIIKFAAYPIDPQEIEDWFERLILEDRPLTCDIETFSLKHHSAGIGTVSLSWNAHEGIAFPVDLGPDPQRVRKALKSFFTRFSQKLTYHNISFDVYVLIYQLFMQDILDTEGLLTGLEIMLKNWDCTKIISYLATNSCAGNDLSLKFLAQEFAGNYAQEDIKDIRKIPLPELLQYNLVDALSAWYVRDKYYPIMVADQQEEIYQTIFRPALIDIIQMQLTGMPVNMKRAIEVNAILEAEEKAAIDRIMASPIIQQYTHHLEEKHVAKRNAALKTKQIKIGDEPQTFNPNSDPQMRDLLFNVLELPVINLTDSKLPSTDGETIEALMHRVTNPVIKELLEAFQMFAIVNVLTTNFMPSILGSVEGPDGWHYLFGNFNLGGTVSGRLSSSGPNLQNLPSTGKGHPLKLRYAKLIKSCFQAPPGWIFGGIDFSSLEDRISALTTKDPNKLKVYTDGYDGHSLRAYAYWPDKMPDIDPNSVASINSIAKKYKPLRDKSKNPTFTLTYQGTRHALIKKYGFLPDEADELVERYRTLYQVSIQWVESKLNQAMQDGYITAAFGLRVRTPLLKQVIRGTNKTPYEAEAEGRTAGNALGQSWCLLNSRAGSEFMGKVRASRFRLDIRPTAQIHDAGYFLFRDNIETVLYANEHLVKATYWQEHPDIAHPDVGLGGELSLFYPSWAEELVLPNGSNGEQIQNLIGDHVQKLKNPKTT